MTLKKRFHGILILCFFLLAGCSFQPVKHLPWWGAELSTRQLQMELDEANRLFMAGDYTSAARIFESVRQSENAVTTRQALYGLACTRLVLSENRKEYLDAVKLLDQWRRTPPASLNREDPRMLLALFPEALPADPADNPEGGSSADEHFLMRSFDYEKKLAELETRILSLNEQIRALEKKKTVINEMEASMKAMEASNDAMKNALKEKEDAARAMEEELAKLRGQIKTIETIDQQIQEKKQEISSP